MSNSTFKSLFWKFLEGGSAQIVQLVVSIFVARLLLPSDFGIVALLLVFTTIASVVVQSGLATALIQQKDILPIDLSSIFIYSFVLAFFLYVMLYLLAPFIAVFYDMSDIVYYMRIMSLILFFGPFTAIQNALVARQMLWKKLCFCNLFSVFFSGFIGLLLAYLHKGAWAIIYQQLSYQFVLSFSLSFVVRWTPVFQFSFKRTIPLLKYGTRLLGANIINTLYHNIEGLIIGKQFAPDILAFFNRGKMFPLVISNNVDGALQSVMLPVLSSRQDCLFSVKETVRSAISVSTFLLFPSLSILFLSSESIVMLLLGENWIKSVPFLRWYCVIGMFFPFQTTSAQAINALGKANVYLKIMTIKRTIGVLLLFSLVLIFNNVFVIVFAAFIVEIIAIMIHIYYNKQILKYRYSEQLQDVSLNFFGTVFSFLVYFFTSEYLSEKLIVRIISVVFLFSFSYILFMLLFRSSNLSYLYSKIIKR